MLISLQFLEYTFLCFKNENICVSSVFWHVLWSPFLKITDNASVITSPNIMFYTHGCNSSVAKDFNQFNRTMCVLTMLQFSHNHIYLTLLNLEIILLNVFTLHSS